MLVNEMLKHGIGVGFLPTSFCGPNENRVYFSTWPPIQSFIGAFYRKNRSLSEPERYFIYLLLKYGQTGVIQGNTYFNHTSRDILKEFEKE